MRIKRVRFRNVGPFGPEGVTLEGFTPGLNVVCETNEFGKSTVLKALETVLFKPFSSADKQVKALRTGASDEALEGEIIFNSEGRDYRLYKRFLKQKGARLQDANTGEDLAIDRGAEEALAKLLRSDQFNGGPSGLLWVRQGTSMEGVADDGQIASRLEGELGTLIGGERARDYLARVEAELSEVLTRSGQEKKHGPLRLAREAVDATTAELTEAKRQRDLTTSIGGDLAKVTLEIARLNREAGETKWSEQIKETQTAMMAAQSFAKELELFDARQAQAKAAQERAVSRQTDHIDALVSFNAAQEKLSALETSHAEKTAELQAAQARRAEIRTAVTEVEARLADASKIQAKRDSAARQRQRLEILQKDTKHLRARLEQIDQLEDEQAKLTEAMSELPNVSRADVENLRRAANELRQYEAELAAQSTRLYLELSPEGRGKVTLNGKTVETGPIELSGGASLSIKGIGELRADNGALRETTKQRDRAKTEYDALLTRFGVSEISEAATIAEARQDIEQSRKHITADMARLAPEGRTAIETDLAAAEAEARDLADILEDSGAEFVAAEDTDILESLRRERAKLDVIEETLMRARRALATSDTEQARLRERVNGLNLPKDELARTAQANALAGEKLKADTDFQAAVAAVEALKAQAPEQSLEMLTARLARLEQVTQQSREGLEELKTKAAGLQARRDAGFEGADADAVVATLEARLINQQSELARQIRAKDVRVLLRDTLIETKTRLREAYTAPVTQELAPLLSRVIPGAEAGLGESLGVDTVQRNGKIEAITQVSGGTQEQFAILTRLAYAQLLAKSGAAAPVILDDALVYADDARRDAMFDVLGLVSSGETPIQIIYLSCHAGATASLGGNRITPQPWPKKA